MKFLLQRSIPFILCPESQYSGHFSKLIATALLKYKTFITFCTLVCGKEISEQDIYIIIRDALNQITNAAHV